MTVTVRHRGGEQIARVCVHRSFVLSVASRGRLTCEGLPLDWRLLLLFSFGSLLSSAYKLLRCGEESVSELVCRSTPRPRGDEEHFGPRDCGEQVVTTRIPHNLRDSSRKMPSAEAPPCGDFPQFEIPVLRRGGQILPVRARGETPHGGGVAEVPLCVDFREGPKLPRLRQVGHQALGVNVQAPLEGAGAEVQVQTPLEPLEDEVLVSAELPEGVEFGGDKVCGAVRRHGLVPSLLLRLVKEVLVRGPVTLRVPR
mmetsp:Transcript_31330/g.42434  ORF Transcript_31330/g.42434 Transcript_31330/m.42434 type:complete len:255 (-) Transcript_31330:935-1699(-)